MFSSKPFQAWVYYRHLHPIQAANCCRNSRLVVDEDDLMLFKNQGKLPCIGKPLSWEFSFQNPFFLGKLNMFSWMWNDAVMHRGGLKG